jgi:hypothetical protein
VNDPANGFSDQDFEDLEEDDVEALGLCEADAEKFCNMLRGVASPHPLAPYIHLEQTLKWLTTVHRSHCGNSICQTFFYRDHHFPPFLIG